MKVIIFSGIFVILAITALIISVRSFHEKGFVFHNAYIYASKEERENMDKKPYYRQSAIAFMLASVILLLMGIAIFFSVVWLVFVVMTLAVIALIYVIISDKAIHQK